MTPPSSNGPSPSAGARFTLERVAGAIAESGGDSGNDPSGLASARYTGEIATPSVTYRADLLLREDGTFDLTWIGEAAPESMHKQLSMFAKLTARSAPARREEGVPIWPARVTRWRPTT